MTNLNDLARIVTLKEGKKQSISIAQVKEVLKIILKELAKEDLYEVINVLKRYK